MSTGARLREERERLGLSQEKFGALGGVAKRAQINYEQDERSPDSAYLSAVAEAGADVLYVLTGQRCAAMPATDAAEQVLLDNYRRCQQPAKQHLIQTSALLAAGVSTAGDAMPANERVSPPPVKQRAGAGAVQVGGSVMHSTIEREQLVRTTRGTTRTAKSR